MFFLNKSVGVILVHILFISTIIHIIWTKNKEEEVFTWAMYWASMEVFMRMSKAYYFYESGKYFVIIILILGLLYEKKKHILNMAYVLYIVLLLFSIAVADFPVEATPRKDIAASLSGPFLAGLSAIYFSYRIISFNKFIYGLKVAILPFISMLIFLYLKTPDIENLNFSTSSNFATAGGFGPNQVSTSLGYAMLILSILFFIRKSFSGIIWIDLILLFYIFYRALLTFSRGGVITAVVSLIIFLFFYFKSKPIKLSKSIPYFSLGILIAIFSWIAVLKVTDGLIFNRYLNQNAKGESKEGLLSNRENYINAEWQIFKENPFLGVGAGAVKYVRADEYDVVGATHNEISRTLSEHGIIGVFSVFLLLFYPLWFNKSKTGLEKAIAYTFLSFWFLTINHSAMRIALPGLIYGLSLITVFHNNQYGHTIHRK